MEAPINLKKPFETNMRSELETYYEEFDELYQKIHKKLNRKNPEKKIAPIIFNFDEAPFWYHLKP